MGLVAIALVVWLNKFMSTTEAYKTIKDASKLVGVPDYVLRFWEKEFPQIKLHKNGQRRYYRQSDIDLILRIKDLLYNKGYTLEGARSHLNAQSTSSYNSTAQPTCDAEQIKAIIEKLKEAKALLAE